MNLLSKGLRIRFPNFYQLDPKFMGFYYFLKLLINIGITLKFPRNRNVYAQKWNEYAEQVVKNMWTKILIPWRNWKNNEILERSPFLEASNLFISRDSLLFFNIISSILAWCSSFIISCSSLLYYNSSSSKADISKLQISR